MQEFKTKKIIILSLISLSLISLKWFLSFYRFPLEDIDLKIINDVYDQSYFPLIKSFSNLDLNGFYTDRAIDSGLISFPFISLIINVIFFKLLGSYSFIILEFFCVFFFLIIFCTIFDLFKFHWLFSLLCSIFLFILPQILIDISFLNLEFINKLSVNFYSFYNLRVPRPIITNLYFFSYIFFILKIYYLDKKNLKNFIILSFIIGFTLNSFFYFFIFQIILLFIVYINFFKKKIFNYILENLYIHLFSIFIIFIFFIIYFIQIKYSEPDYLIRLGVYNIDTNQKTLLFKYSLNFFLNINFIILFLLNTLIYFFNRNNNNNIFYFLFLSTIFSTLLFITLSNRSIDYYHFFNWIIISGLLYLIVNILFFFNKIFINKFSNNLKNFSIIFLTVLMISYYNISNSKNFLFNKNEDLSRKENIEITNFITQNQNYFKKEYEILSFNYDLSLWLILNNYKNFSFLNNSFWTSKTNNIIENEILSVFKFLNLNYEDFNSHFENKKKGYRYYNLNTTSYFGRRYLSNQIKMFGNLDDYDVKYKKIITSTSPLISHQVIIPKKEFDRFKIKFNNSDKNITDPDIIILEKNNEIFDKYSVNLDVYCVAIKNDNLEILLKKDLNEVCIFN